MGPDPHALGRDEAGQEVAAEQFAQGPAQTGLNLGTLAPGSRVRLSFAVRARSSLAPGALTVF